MKIKCSFSSSGEEILTYISGLYLEFKFLIEENWKLSFINLLIKK